MDDLRGPIRQFWEEEAATYDRSPSHRMTPVIRAAWMAELERLLPPAPARILDVGAGTGYLSLSAARLGHDVLACDLSPGMLGQLEAAARRDGLAVRTVVGTAEEPPDGPFDVVMERHLLWTLPEPTKALGAWRAVAPGGRLLLFEKVWSSADPVEKLRKRAYERLRRLRGLPDDYHAPYPDEVMPHLPRSSGMRPSTWVAMVAEAGWARGRLHRLRDVEWALAVEAPVLDRLVGWAPIFVVAADDAPPSPALPDVPDVPGVPGGADGG